MGSTSDWLPSRRSVDSQRGGLSIVFEGHDRSGRFSGGNLLYFVDGSLSIGMANANCPMLLSTGIGFWFAGK
jgi:hypothetical protein